uniref:CCDC50_N domain-containing protein n=1 Tax=Steinernema glaseri TaxID=37863 RepID=A0A1I7ZYF9_9BILA
MAGRGGGGNVSRVRDQLQNYSDFNLAYKLQEEEFGHYYDHNRNERRLVGGDTRTAKQRHLEEMMKAQEERRKEAQRIAAADEDLARRLHEQYNREAQPQPQQPSSLTSVPQSSQSTHFPAVSPPQYDGSATRSQNLSAHPSGCFPVIPPVDLASLQIARPKTAEEQLEEDARLAQEMAALYQPPPGNLEEDERIARRLQEKYDRRSRRLQEANPSTETPRRPTALSDPLDRGGDRCIQCQGPMPLVSLATDSPEDARRCNECRRTQLEPPPYDVAVLCSTPTCAPPLSLGWNTSQVARRTSPVQDQVGISHIIGSIPLEPPRTSRVGHSEIPPFSQLAAGRGRLDDPLPPPPLVSMQPAKPEPSYVGQHNFLSDPIQDQGLIGHTIGPAALDGQRRLLDLELPPPSQLAIGNLSDPLPPPPPPVLDVQTKPITQNPPIAHLHPTNPFLQDLLQLHNNGS